MPTRRSLFTIAGSLPLCVLLWTTIAHSQNPLPPILGAVLVGRNAYVLQPPEMIASGNITQHSISSSGAYVLVVRKTPPRLPTSPTERISSESAEVTLSFWDTATRKGGVLWRGASTEQQPLGMQLHGFFHDSNLALIRIERGRDERPKESQFQFLLVNVAKRTVREITTGTLGEKLIASRFQARSALFSEEGKTMRFITPEGTVSQAYPLAIPGWNTSGMGAFIFWTWQKDGKNLLGQYVVKDENGQPKRARVLLDSNTGKITPYTGEPEYERAIVPPPLPFQVRADSGEVKRGDAAVTLTPFWLEGTEPDAEGRVLITPNGSDPELLSRAVLYFSEGALYVAPIQRMDRETYVALRRQQWKTQTIHNARKIGVAMMQYAHENGGNLPSPESDLRKVLAPYLKNNAAWNNVETGKPGFQPIYKQTLLSSFSSLPTVPLGALTGPDGRAVLYGDGHVEWEDSP